MSILKALTFKIGMHGVGFELTRSKTLGLESNPLDHSHHVLIIFLKISLNSFLRKLTLIQ